MEGKEEVGSRSLAVKKVEEVRFLFCLLACEFRW